MALPPGKALPAFVFLVCVVTPRSASQAESLRADIELPPLSVKISKRPTQFLFEQTLQGRIQDRVTQTALNL